MPQKREELKGVKRGRDRAVCRKATTNAAFPMSATERLRLHPERFQILLASEVWWHRAGFDLATSGDRLAQNFSEGFMGQRSGVGAAKQDAIGFQTGQSQLNQRTIIRLDSEYLRLPVPGKSWRIKNDDIKLPASTAESAQPIENVTVDEIVFCQVEMIELIVALAPFQRLPG